ncbi:hypothetical protein D7Z26_02600 [Cohnella endophytica]|uniref:Anti-sigma-W factor RsiW n=1 Tax=Cohnella endophytica TaxID=2419778 RepID=A0A494Y9A6_9BACL|nr:anti-sigma factor [Cohnella endophytica]RKP56898.1 hypothetical protein D7Z26_02600 [Cohnella endophytica]
MSARDNRECEGLFEYLSGEGSDVERKRFEKHLASCTVCTEEAGIWREVWDRLGEDLEILEPPADLKDEVLGTIFAAEHASELTEATHSAKPTRGVKRFRSRLYVRGLLVVSALVIPFLLGWFVRDLQRAEDSRTASIQSPDRIETLFQLAAVRSSGKFEDSPHAYGVACLVKSENKEQFVVYVFGTPKTEAAEAYQVWLLKDGKRTSAGTFTVDESGIGIMALPIEHGLPKFDSVGITLEPDSRSDAPRGPKMFGSMKPDSSSRA